MLYSCYMFNNIINLLYPASCQVCGKKSKSPNQYLCKECVQKIKKRQPPFCIKCGHKLKTASYKEDLCPDCKKKTPYFDQAASIFYYDGVFKKLVHDFKYKKNTSLVTEFAEFIISFMDKHNIAKETDLVLSIPMHPLRLLKREINPSNILARNVAKKLNLPYSENLLKKTKNTLPQSQLNRSERIENIKNSFSLKKSAEPYLKHKNILFVDDLFTTGSTVNECSRILKEKSVKRIEVITLARGDISI